MSEKIGMCSECKEMTAINEPCCNAPVFFEGAMYTLEQAEEELAKEEAPKELEEKDK